MVYGRLSSSSPLINLFPVFRAEMRLVRALYKSLIIEIKASYSRQYHWDSEPERDFVLAHL